MSASEHSKNGSFQHKASWDPSSGATTLKKRPSLLARVFGGKASPAAQPAASPAGAGEAPLRRSSITPKVFDNNLRRTSQMFRRASSLQVGRGYEDEPAFRTTHFDADAGPGAAGAARPSAYALPTRPDQRLAGISARTAVEFLGDA